MDTKFFCPRWGNELLGWRDFFEKAATAGYNGIEWAIPSTASQNEIDRVMALSDIYQMPVIAQHFDTTSAEFDKHLAQYRDWLERIAPYAWLKINSQTGKDHFSLEQNKQLIGLAEATCKLHQVPLVHETHRGKFSYAVHETAKYLRELHELKLTLDVSHWYCVAESYLHDQPEHLSAALERTDHIHARVGYTQGPQVTDPAEPRWQEALAFHLMNWDKVVDQKRSRLETITMTTEFGPFPYCTVEKPGHSWAVNVWMLNHLKQRYQS